MKRGNRECPICSKEAIMQCRCPKADMKCENGHNWHTCAVHGTVVMGAADHTVPTFECSCLKKNKGMAENGTTAKKTID